MDSATPAAIPPALPWSTTLTVSAATRTPASLGGDKILLPSSALEQLIRLAEQAPPASENALNPWARPTAPKDALLPHPMIVQLRHRATGASVFAVPREFSAGEGEVVLSMFLRGALALADGDDGDGAAVVDVNAASLPKGTSVRLRPLEAGYDDEDWKPILERYIRERFATVAEGMVLEVPRGVGKGGAWRFLVDQALPGGAVCVVDTDLAVDIEPLDEEQARETLKRKLQKKSAGGKVELGRTVAGEVAAGDEHFYELESWDHTRPLVIELGGEDLVEGEDVDLFVTSDCQHKKPRLDEHVWGDMGTTFPKRVLIAPANVELAAAKTLHIGIRGWRDPEDEPEPPEDAMPRRYTLSVTQAEIPGPPANASVTPSTAPSPDHKQCRNCTQWIPSRTFFLHESFCLRNNVHCRLCNSVFKRGTESAHWHCPDCNAHGNHPSSRLKHTSTTHTPHPCRGCHYVATSLHDLASHRTTVCADKLILCRFCHLLVPQEGAEQPSAEEILTGLSHHELQCGARTTECNLCGRRTRLRDMDLHLKNHDIQRLTRPLPNICTNPLCYRSPALNANTLGLCDVCFGPLYTPNHDPTGSALQSRVERKLLRQLLAGCGKIWCRSPLCKGGRKNLGMAEEKKLGAKEAMPLVRACLAQGEVPLCVDELTARRRDMAEALEIQSVADATVGKGGYALQFCCRAVEAARGDFDGARTWLAREGVRAGER